ADLLRCPPDCRGRGDDLGANTPFAVLARRQPVYCGFIEPRDGSERPRNQVQLVLYDQIRRVETGAVEQWATAARSCAVKPDLPREMVNSPKNPAAPAHPGRAGEFVDRSNQKGRQPPINRFIDVRTGNARLPVKSQESLAQRISRFCGVTVLGVHWKDCRPNC